MDIYVKSAGVSKDYSWLDQNGNKITDPPNIKPVIEMVDSDYFSVVLYRVNGQQDGNDQQDEKGQLCLLVTGLETKNRTDNRNRKIKNSVLWVGKASDEATLRAIAIQALNEKLAAQVDQAIDSKKDEENPQGFKVEFKQLKPENLSLEAVEQKTADSNSKIGNLSALKNELINDLRQYSLPIKEGMLVVVSKTVSQSSLEREKVWRGLSDAIPGDEWIDLPVKEEKGDGFPRQPSLPSSNTSTTAKSVSLNSENNNTGNSKGVQPQPRLTIGQKVLSILLAISIIINIGLFLQWQEAIKNQKEYENLQEKSKDLQIKLDKNTQEIETQKQTIETQKQKIAEQKSNLERGSQILNKIVEFTKKFDTEGRKLLDETNNFSNGIQK